MTHISTHTIRWVDAQIFNAEDGEQHEARTGWLTNLRALYAAQVAKQKLLVTA